MKKKLLAVLLSTAMVAGILSGCGSAPKEEEAPKTEQAAEPADTTAKEDAEGAKEAEADNQEEEKADPASVTGEFVYWTYTDNANNLLQLIYRYLAATSIRRKF